MKCKKCESENNRVIDSRGGAWIRRRRECLECGTRWTTFEIPNEEIKALVKVRELVKEIRGDDW